MCAYFSDIHLCSILSLYYCTLCPIKTFLLITSVFYLFIIKYFLMNTLSLIMLKHIGGLTVVDTYIMTLKHIRNQLLTVNTKACES